MARLRPQAIRIAQLTTTPTLKQSSISLPSRAYSTTAPHDQQKQSTKTSSTNSIYAALGVAALAGAYWYYVYEDPRAVKIKAKETEHDVNQKVRQSVDQAKGKMASARSEVEGQARQVEADLQSKYDSSKVSAQKTLQRARDSTENLFNQARSTADRELSNAQSGAEKTGEEVKAGWLSWLGWGKSEAKKGKRDAAGKVAETAEDVRQRADKQS